VQVNITSLSPTEREAAFEVTAGDLQPHFDRAYEKFRPKAELKGFRKGKVPLAMIRKVYGEAIEHDALDEIANSLFRQAMEEQSVAPLGTPSMTSMDYKPKESFRFTVAFEVKPEITLGRYRGIEVEKPVRAITDAEVEEEIHHLRRSNSTTSETEAVTDPEHLVTADVQELDETGSPLVGKKSAGTRFYLADPSLAPGIKEALAAARPGETVQATAESSHEDHKHTHRLAITVTKVEKVHLPPFDAELVAKVTGGSVSSPEEFRQSIRADLQRYWEQQGMSRVNDAIANEVVRMHEIPVPASLVAAYLDSFKEDIASRSKDRKLPATFDEAKFRTENTAYATWQAKWFLLREAIARQEGITVTDDDISALAQQEAGRIGIEAARLLEYYRKSGSVTERLLGEKVMTFLREHAVVKDVPVSA
jgi:trigger factor